MAVLKGPLAVRQSKSLVRMFKQMKDFILQNQPLLGQREYLQLSLQTTDNIRDIMELRSDLARLDDNKRPPQNPEPSKDIDILTKA